MLHLPCGTKVASKSNIERIVVIGQMTDLNLVSEQLFNDNYLVTYQGPYTTKAMFPNADITRFKIVAEKYK